MSNWPEQLFVLSNEAIEGMAWEDVSATATAMKEAGLWKPPFSRFAVHVKAKHFMNPTPDGRWAQHGGFDNAKSELHGYDLRIHFKDPRDDELIVSVYLDTHDGRGFIEETATLSQPPIDREQFINTMNAIYMYTLVLLATKNIKKDVKEDKLARMGIGTGKGKKRFRYTTTISVGAVTENADGSPTAQGALKRPHFRRGHVRRQHWGPGFQYEKMIFVEGVFVNADREWVEGGRDHYNVRKASC